jgi:hypothetical protein
MSMATPPRQEYPWFGTVEGDDIEQGDVLENCPVFLPPEDLVITAADHPPVNTNFKWEERDLVVMSQSCDLTKGRSKIDDVLLCAVWRRSELPDKLAKDEGMENVRLGRMPGFQLLADCNLAGFEREVRVVDFRRVYSLPIAFVRRRAMAAKRLRLLPPYREHLSQSFARFFMRVGLPVDIPPFKGKK